VTRIVDRGAIAAAYVGIGMALTIAVSFLLVIPIEPIYWLLAVPAGLLIGYYANQRSDRRAGPWRRILANAVVAGLATALTLAALLLIVKALFFFADGGFPDFNRVDENGQAIAPFCDPGANCVYSRYLAAGRGPDFASIGVADTASFNSFYWREQFATSAFLILLTTGGGLGGGILYGLFRPRAQGVAARSPATSSSTAGDAT
jgi:hypothetical protein